MNVGRWGGIIAFVVVVLALGGCGGRAGGPIAAGRGAAARLAATSHQADTNDDNKVAIDELTAYIQAWKTGQYDSIDLVTNAISLWKSGETYHFDSAANPPFVTGAGGPNSSDIKVSISPTTLQATGGQQYQFQATVTGTANAQVTWRVREGGTIDATGLLTAPTRAGTYHVDVISVADPHQSATATVTVIAANSNLPFSGTRSYDVAGMGGGVLNGTGLQLTITNAPTAGRALNGLQVEVNAANGLFHHTLMTIQQILQNYLAGVLTTTDGRTATVEIRFANNGDSLTIVIRFETVESTGNALKMLVVTATAAAPDGFCVRRSVKFGGAALALVQGARVVQYEWDFDGDGTYDATSTTTPEATHVYEQAGTYAATLRVTDSRGGVATDTLNLSIIAGSAVVTVQ